MVSSFLALRHGRGSLRPVYPSRVVAAPSRSQHAAPNGPMFRIETDGLENALDRGVSGMNFRADSVNTALLCRIDQPGQQTAGRSFITPGLLDEQFHTVHGFAAEFRAPFI